MKYRNIKNGAVIDVSTEINDKNWELITPGSSLIEKETIKTEAPKEEIKEVVKSKKTSSKKTTTIHPKKKKEG